MSDFVSFGADGSFFVGRKHYEQEPEYVQIDGEQFTQEQASALVEMNMIQECPDRGAGCEHDYHAYDRYTSRDLWDAREGAK